MGLFSNKKTTKVNVTVQRIFNDENLPDSARQGVIKGIMNNENIVDHMLEDLAGSIGVRLNTGQGWAKKNDYYFGLPAAQVKSNIDARAVTMGVIANNVGQAVTPIYYTMAPMNSFHYAWTWLVNVHGYNPSTNEIVGLRASTGAPCYLKDMIATYTQESFDFMQETFDMGMVDQLGPPPNSGYTPSNPFTALSGIGPYNKQPSYEVSSVAVEDYVTIKYEFEQSPGQFVERGLTLSLSGVDLSEDFHQARYTKADGSQGFFTYMQGSGTYPIIDQVFSISFSPLGTYYPWVYFRVNEERVKWMADLKAYDDAKAFCSYLGVNYDLIDDGVEKDDNVDDVQQSMLMIGLPPGDKDPACIQYLFKHFNVLHENAVPVEDKANQLLDQFSAFTSSPSQIQVVQDKFFTMSFQFSGIVKHTKPGKVGKKGTYTSEYAVVSQDYQTIFTNGPGGIGTGVVMNGQPAWIYRYQNTDSTYEEIAVYGLRGDYRVHRKKGFGAGATDPELLIPVDRAIMRFLSVGSKERVVTRGLYMFVGTAIQIKTPWYASSIFKAVIIIVSIVITIFTAGAAWQAIVAAAAISTTAVVITIISMIVSALAVKYGVQLFVKKFGPRAGFIAAIALIAVSAYGSAGNAGWSDSLLAISSNLTEQSTQAYAEIIQDIQSEIMDFNEYAKGMFDSLADKAEQLGLNGQNVGLEPLEMVYRVPEIRIGEVPNDFYNRTVHSGNIGVTSYDMVEFFVDAKLRLPTTADTSELEEDNGMAI